MFPRCLRASSRGQRVLPVRPGDVVLLTATGEIPPLLVVEDAAATIDTVVRVETGVRVRRGVRAVHPIVRIAPVAGEAER